MYYSRALLETAMEKHSPRQEPPDEKEEEGKEEEREEEEEGERVERKPGAAEHHFRVDVENISVSAHTCSQLLPGLTVICICLNSYVDRWFAEMFSKCFQK